jgi:hypothetical protein
MFRERQKKVCVQKPPQACVACCKMFIVTAHGQAHKLGKGWSDPKRCLACRQQSVEKQEAGGREADGVCVRSVGGGVRVRMDACAHA